MKRPAEHGTRSRYNQGCRCTSCRGANATYHQQHRLGLERLGKACPRLVPHGQVGYREWRCRCGVCRAAVNGPNWGDGVRAAAG